MVAPHWHERTLHVRPAAGPIVAILCASLTMVLGCRGKAQSDLYRQKMASEIRVLEDQLYDADYQNRVLRDQVQRLQRESRRIETPAPARQRPAPADSAPPDRSPAVPSTDDIPDVPSIEIDDGIEAPLLDLPEMPDSGQTAPIEGPDRGETSDRPAETPKPSTPGRGSFGMPPPGVPEPPGKDDLELPEIIPGEIVPPPEPDAQPDKPPGQIMLDETIQSNALPMPERLQIHRGLSGGHQFDGDEDVGGLYLVVNAIDQTGRMIELTDYDVDAELTVVALDPTKEGRAARVGRWEFDAAQVKGMVREDPSSGLHIPIRWQDAEPSSNEVIVHVRLRSDEDEMRCQDTLRVGAEAAMTKWTPRGEPID